MIPKNTKMENDQLKKWKNTIQNMDCIDGLKKIPDKSVDLIIADPPYFKTINEEWDYKWRTEEDYIEWVESWIKELSRVVKTNCSFWLFGYVKILSKILPLAEKYGFVFRQQIVVDKGMRSISGRKTSTYKMFPTTTESIFFFVKNNQPNIKRFLKEKQKEFGYTAKQINDMLECKSNGGGLWSLYSGDNILAQIPTKEMWEKLQQIFKFKMDYSEVNFTFNPQMGYTDVLRDIDFLRLKKMLLPYHQNFTWNNCYPANSDLLTSSVYKWLAITQVAEPDLPIWNWEVWFLAPKFLR